MDGPLSLPQILLLIMSLSSFGQVRKEARRGEEGRSVGSVHAAVLEHITAVAARCSLPCLEILQLLK